MLHRVVVAVQRRLGELIGRLEGEAESTESGWLARAIVPAFASLSLIERQQIASLLRRHQGWSGLVLLFRLLIAGSMLGLLLHLLKPAAFSWLGALLLGNVILISVALATFSAWVFHQRHAANQLRVSALLALLALLGVAAGSTAAGLRGGSSLFELGRHLLQQVLPIGVVFGSAYAALLAMISTLRNRELAALNDSLQAQAERERLARQLSESQLRLLQAQIEPHFLFNTLGAVQHLAEDGAPRAAALTGDLIQFLRASLAQMRAEQVTLAEDFRLVDAYLKVMQVRLGARLRYELHLPAQLAGNLVPSMVLLTLVENAIKHGIEPAIRGGEMVVSAKQDEMCLLLQVADSGVGLADDWHSGIGLANVRERLQLAFAGAASLSLSQQPTGGTVASVSLPLFPMPGTEVE
ncbi:sensor histidine kinase [Chitinimonas sp.]|uniref:sensor histidine kinase n=1 Tax=Chitinimonas sp. TaxID=1934313 RepID=UPI0035B309DB